ncbi:hypothetical protein C1T31_06725 [Hanstruepera neustonica]|uniref:TonB C-terminal domain-containing protein n=1 Tax=Hanstruepera neustonica TaxID=1445657 RepID=A0A2K1E162_9FLAO|nr:energy transducer TonB [Hanstruepera neustonica]PNQ74011.1 hypothetical protein C1T31_06725 [Hanstruepera neustonica]
MNFSRKNHELIRQNEVNVKKSQKHDVNLQKNSTLYFQIGLILCLLFAYGLLEMKFLKTETTIPDMAYVDDVPTEFSMDKYEIYREPVEKIEKTIKKQIKYSNKIEVAKNTDDVEENTDEIFDENLPTTDEPIKPEKIVVDKEPEGLMNIMLVETVPVFPGCEKLNSNQERRDCMSSKLTKFIQKKFDTDLGSELGLKGKQKIYVNFKINRQGEVEILQTQATHDKLGEEANRVVNKLPRMTPGKHGNKTVDVLYTLPIAFTIQN